MDLAAGIDFVSDRHQGVVATIQPDGRPHLSNVVYAWNGEAVEVSVTLSRVKTRNVERDPRASLYVADGFRSWVVLDATVELGPVAAQAGDPGLEDLRRLYERISGPHPDWEDYDRAMIADRRLVMRLFPVRAYGLGI